MKAAVVVPLVVNTYSSIEVHPFQSLAMSRINNMAAWAALSFSLVNIGLVGCSPEVADDDPPIRGLRAFEVGAEAQFLERRYPGVIRPHEETQLSFEVSGQLENVALKEGQAVKADERLLALDTTSFDLHAQEARASLRQAQAQQRNARVGFERQSELWEKRVIPRSIFDDAEAQLSTTTAQVEQAGKRLEIAEDNLAKTTLQAPFDGYVASVEVDAFANISAGRPVLTLFADDAFEAEISVPSVIINNVTVGLPVKVIVADLEDAEFHGTITEVGSRAREVAAFPVVAVLNDPSEKVKAGMSAEVVLELSLANADQGFLIPLTCFAFDAANRLQPDRTQATVFVYNPETSTVDRRTVTVTEIRENAAIVHNGLEIGEFVASAGVSYLRDGQRVTLLESN